MKTTCFVIVLSVMVVCVASRLISRTQIKDVYEDPKECRPGCYKECCEGKPGENLCTPESEQTVICKSECFNCRKRSFKGYVSDPSPCEKGCKKGCCEGANGEDLCIQGSKQEEICDDECKNCEKRSLPGLMAKRRRTLYETLMAMARREEGDGEYPSESSYYKSPECQACRKTECGDVDEIICDEICAC